MTGFIVTGTDTDVGKTVFAAALAGYLDGWYWKPVATPADSAASFASTIVSARPPVRATTGTQP